MFSEIQLSEQQSHFIAKLEQCCYLCDWNNDSPATEQDRETKTRYLKDVVTYVTNSKNVFPEAVWPSVMKMIQANIFRPFPIQDKGMFDLDDDEPNLDPAWAHLQFVYEILFRFVLSNEVDPKVAIRLFTPEFINNVIDLFDSEDARERD
ncbi:MAG: putative Serine/threonine protein phosphatase 2A 59 kDa regulatory subunit B' eta, partial [Streblomastix strix]